MNVRVLGILEASVNGRALHVGAGKPRALLAFLALHPGETVSTERLIDGLWGEQPPATATKLVQLYVSQLRKALAACGDGAAIATRGHGYELQLAQEDVDAGRFEQLVADGAPREALALWRGPPLDDVAGEPFAAPAIRRLEELRLSALEQAIDADLEGGRHREVVVELDALVAEEPLRERLHAQRMLALYRSGRQADALEAYRQARRTLVEHVGVEPGPELRRLQEAILAQDPALDPPAQPELPPELEARTPLLGRDADLDWLRELWRDARAGRGTTVLLSGVRGIGKTRLAAELAAEAHRDGALVLYASGAGSPDAALATLERVRAARGTTLLVLDDLDRAGPRVHDALPDDLARRPAMLLATALQSSLRSEATLRLGPLDADGVRGVAELYAGTRADDVPVERLTLETGGVPQRIHRAAREWASTEAARRLSAAADRAASGRADLRAAEDEVARDVEELQAVRPVSSETDSSGVDAGIVACPFKGLASFDVEDAEVFFGRERLLAEMVARLAGAPLLAVVGPSGSGKSSALRAGLLASLAAGVLPGSERWRIALLRPGAHPLGALDQATDGVAGRAVLAVDQFEELFTACRSEIERAAFVDALVARAADARRRMLVLIAVRADFYGHCAAYPELSRLVGANHVLVGPMRRDDLRRAIELPAQRAGLRVEPELVDALVADVADEPGALPLLSSSLLELWQRRDGRQLRMSAYDQAGGVRGAVARLAERAYEQLPAARRPVARRILLRLAEGEGDAVVRRRVPLAALEGEGVEGTLSVLADQRLVTIGEGEVEVAHEALLREWPRLRGWLEEDAEGRRVQAHLIGAARDWQAGGRDPGELYRGARLAAALDWAASHGAELNEGERAFLDASRAAGERSHRRLQAVLAGVAALLALALVAGVVALEQRGSARQEAVAADAQRLGSRALAENDLDRSLLLARQGIELDDSPQTRGSLLAALIRSPAAIGVMRGVGERMTALALSPDGRTLAAGDRAGNVFLFDTLTGRRVTAPDVHPGEWPITALAWSPDGRRLAASYLFGDSWSDGDVVRVVDAGAHRLGRRLELYDYMRAVTGLRFATPTALDVASRPSGTDASPRELVERFDVGSGRRMLGPVTLARRQVSPLLPMSGGRVLTASDGRLVIRDGGTYAPLDGVTVGALEGSTLALSPDERTAAVGGAEGSVRFVDLRSGAVRRASGRHDGPVTAARFTPDGRSLVTTSDDGDAIRWDVRAAAPAETFSGHASGVTALQVSAEGPTLYTAGLDGSVIVWDLAGTRRLGRPFEAGGPNHTQAALSSDGRRLAIGQADGKVSLVDLAAPGRRRTFPVFSHGDPVNGIRFVPGGPLLMVIGPNQFAALVNTDNGHVVRTLGETDVEQSPDYRTPGVSADGQLAAILGIVGIDTIEVRLWQLHSGQLLGGWPMRVDRESLDAQLSPDGRLLVSAADAGNGGGGAVDAWDVRSRRLVHQLRLARVPSFVRFSPDGRLFAVGNNYGETRVYATATMKLVTRVLSGDAGGILSAVITRDDRTMATGSDSGAVQLWDIPSGQALGAPLPGVPSHAVVPAFTPDGTHLIAAYDTGRAYVWDIRPSALARHACQVAGRRLSRAEWEEFLPGRPYAPAC
jgi:DNA-binding SARP family transcriptional activator/WD40 repeat protein